VHTWGSATMRSRSRRLHSICCATDLMPEVNQEVGVRMAVLVFAEWDYFCW